MVSNPNLNYGQDLTDNNYFNIPNFNTISKKYKTDNVNKQINELNKDSISKNNDILNLKEVNRDQAKKLQEQIDKTSEFDNKILDLQTKLDKLERNIKDLKNIETKTLESLALFATLFTFISINIQVFSKVENLGQAGIFTSLLAFALITFLGFYFSRTREDWKILVITSLLFLLFSFGFAYWGFSQSTLPNCLSQTTIQDPQKCALTLDEIKNIISKIKN